jgi:arylsulfatase A-like enzyme
MAHPLRYPALLLYCLLLFGCPAGEDDSPAAAEQPPNIVLIVTDDLGWFDLATYGNDFIETPNLDRLAAGGIQFTHGYASAAICSPSRSTLLTGRHPIETNITEHIHGNRPPRPGQLLRTPPINQQLDLNFQTSGEYLKNQGYATAYIGKWHLGGGQFHPENRGFDLTYGAGANGLPRSFFHPFFPPGQFNRLKQETQAGDYLTDILTDKALEFINDRRDSAFFLNLNYYAPHVPIMGKEELIEKYQQKRAANPTDSFPDVVYAAMVDAIDQNVGRILDRLDELGLAENTLVIFTSDNGGLHVEEVPAFAAHTPPTDNGMLRAGKGYLYEGGTRVPFIVRWPARIMEGQELATPVIGQDIFDAFRDPSGMSPLFGNAQPDRLLIWHAPHYTPQGGKPASSLRQGDYKLVYDYETKQSSQFNLATDPGEENDLTDTDPERSRELTRLLQSRLADMGAQLPTPL